MAEITTLEEKLAEVTGLARAAVDATEKVEGMVDDEQVTEVLQRMRGEADETDERCSGLIDQILGKLNEKAGEEEVGQLVDWALPIQERHFKDVKDCSLKLASEEDPNA